MKMSQREMVLAMLTGTIILFGMSAILARGKISEWKEIVTKQENIAAEIRINRKTIADRPIWGKKLGDLHKSLPEYPAAKKMDVQWLSTMDSLAAKHGVKILKRQAVDEKRVGDIYELPIECKEWEGNLAAIVHFLFDLQSQGAMLDIRQLQMKPKAGDVLRGYFSLYCAYAKQGKPATEKKTNGEKKTGK